MSAKALEAEFGPELGAGKAPPPQSGGIRKVSYSHDAMIDQIIADPCVSQGTLASMFGYTQGWVSQVISSDAFQARLAARKDEIVDPTLRMTVEERIKSLVVRSLEILHEKLALPAQQVPNSLVLKALELGAKGLGLGGNAPPAPAKAPDINLLADRLVVLRGDVYAVERRPNEKIIEQEPVLPAPG